MRVAFIIWIDEYCESIMSLFVCFIFGSFMISSFLHHAPSLCLSLSFVSIISILFASIFPCVMMTCSRPEAAGEACHTLRSTLRF